MSCIKNYFVGGNLQNDLKLRAHNHSELSRGVWNICVSQCVAENYTDEEFCVGLTTNFVKGYKSSTSSESVQVWSTLNIFVLEKNKKQVKNFDHTWHYINNYSDELEFKIVDLKTNSRLTINCEVYLVVQLQRIK
jgi:hypothetical protein